MFNQYNIQDNDDIRDADIYGEKPTLEEAKKISDVKYELQYRQERAEMVVDAQIKANNDKITEEFKKSNQDKIKENDKIGGTGE